MDGESTGDPGEKPSGGDAPDRAPGADDVDSRPGNRPERGFDPAARLAERERPDPDYTSGVLAKYGATFGSAADGAVTNPGAKRE